MAIHKRFERATMEIQTPPTIDGVTPEEGILVTRYDDVANTVEYFWLLNALANADGGTYKENWWVQNKAQNASYSAQHAVAVPALANERVMVVIPPVAATAQTTRGFVVAANTDAALEAVLFSGDNWSSNVYSQRARTLTLAQFEAGIGNPGDGLGWLMTAEF